MITFLRQTHINTVNSPTSTVAKLYKNNKKKFDNMSENIQRKTNRLVFMIIGMIFQVKRISPTSISIY